MSSRRPPAALPPGVVAPVPPATVLPPPPPPPHRRHQHSQFDHTAPRPPVPGEECVQQIGDEWPHVIGQQDYPGYPDLPSPVGGGGAAPLTPHKAPYVNHLGGDGSMMPPPVRPPSSKRYLYDRLDHSGKPPMADPPMKGGGNYKDSYHHAPGNIHPYQRDPPPPYPRPTTTTHLDDPRSESPSYTTTSTNTATNSSSSSGGGGNQPTTGSSACLRWATSLHFLLQDVDGSDLFRRFLRAEHPDHARDALDFWFACEGLRTHSDPKTVGQLVRVIYKRYFRKPTLPYISEQMRSEIGRFVKSLGSGQTPPVTIFDEAQAQIEEAISNNTYRHFLASDMYLQHIQVMQSQTSCSESGSSSSSSNNLTNFQKNPASLPTIPEDSPSPSNALHTPDCINSGYHTPLLTKDQLFKTQNARLKFRPTPEEKFVRPRGSSHLTPAYYSYNPNSRRDSEQQSVSSQSDVCTDDSRLHTDSSTDGRSFHRQAKQYARWNQETEINAIVIPRTQRRDSRQFPPRHPDEFAALLTDKLNSFLKKQNEQELFKRKLQEIESTSSLGEKSRDPQDLERTTEAIVDEDDCQGILDEHVSRVFSQDHSPTRNIHRSSNVRTSKRHHRDATSTFSADSGNVHDYYSDTQQQHHLHHPHGSMVKSHSMPEYYPHPPPVPGASGAGSGVRGSGGATGAAATAGRRPATGKRLSAMVETDSGVSVVSDTSVLPDRVLNWVLESDIGTRGVGYSHSEMSHGSNHSSRHPQLSTATTAACNPSRHYGGGAAYGNSRSSSMERNAGAGANIGVGGPAQPFVADPSLPMPLPPNTASQLEEAVKRLEDMRNSTGRTRVVVGGTSQRTPGSGRHHQDVGSFSAQSTLARSSFRSSKSVSATQQQQLPTPDSGTTVLVKFCEEEIPYRIVIPGHNVTLKQFKEYLPKKGVYRYFFKTKCDELDNQVIQEEVSHDSVVLPLWEGKIITATVKPID